MEGVERRMTKTIIKFNYDNGTRSMLIDGVCSNKRSKINDDKIAPFIKNVVEEVKNQPKTKQKKILKYLRALSVSMIAILNIPEEAQAQTLKGYPLMGDSTTSELIPAEIMDILKQIILACGTVSVSLACIFLMISGIYWMIGNKVKSRQWTEDIVKGLGLVTLAPVTILLLIKLVSLIFKNTPVLGAFF